MLRKWCGLSSAGYLLIVMLAAAWAISYGCAIDLKAPVDVSESRLSLSLHRGLVTVTLLDNAPQRERARFSLSRRDNVCNACWDALYWNDSYAGFSANDGTAWIADPNGGSVSRMWKNVVLPVWGIFVLASIIPAHRVLSRWQARRRASRGECRDCGYDLGGIAGECPACVARRQVIGAGPRLHLVSHA